MKLIRNDRRQEYLLVDISVEELAILTTAVNLFQDDIQQRGLQMPRVQDSLEQVRAAFLADNTIKI